MGIGCSTLTYFIFFILNIYFRPFNLAISTKLYNFAAVIESRFLYNLRAFSSPAEGVRLPISLMARMLNSFWWGVRPTGGREENVTNGTKLDGGSHLQQT